MNCRRVLLFAVLIASAFVPALASAQGVTTASITGVVRDASGAVLPGVTVEAASPVLIEKVRSATTDGTGRYQIINLLPGSYTVTYTLAGFSTVKRDALQLSGSAVATVDIELRLGSLEETITVSGESPVVDVQTVKQQRVVDQETINSIPGSRMYQNIVALVPGVQVGQNVGGINGPAPALVSSNGGNSAEGRINVDGLGVNGSSGGGSLYVTDTANVSEVTIDVTGGLGEAEVGGPVINVIPRTGGNVFSGNLFFAGANGSMQGSNWEDSLVAAGLREPGKLKKMWDLNGAFGGPIMKDKLWFFGTSRYQGTQRYVAGMYYNLNAGVTNLPYAPDLSRQAITDGVWDNSSIRTTWQATPRNKFNFFWDEQHMCRNCTGGGTATTSPEAQDTSQDVDFMRAYQVSYTSPVTSRLLLEAGFGATQFHYGNPREGALPGAIRINEQCSPVCSHGIANLTYGANFYDQVKSWTPRYRGSLTYVTGTHNTKIGYDAYHAISDRTYERADGLTYRFNNGIPNQLTMILDGFRAQAAVQNTAIFAQDRWTLGRFSLSGGVRYEHASSKSPEQTIGPLRFVPNPIVFPAQSLVKGYDNITVRSGLAVDVFGNQKTSLRVNGGRYLDPAQYLGIYVDPNPASTLFGNTTTPPQTTRNWTDSNGNYVPDCDLLTPTANGECGAMANLNFGRTQTPTATYDPGLLEGWGVRPGNWQFGIGVQQQLLPRMSVEVNYNRRWFDAFSYPDNRAVSVTSVTDNRAVTPADYQEYSITVPTDARLPGGGGYTIGNLFDISPTAFGRTDNYITRVKNFGTLQNYWHGVNVQLNARLRNGLTLQGGTSTGRAVTDVCDLIVDNPSTRNCRAVMPWQTDIRGLAVYTLPKVDVQVSSTLQSRVGPEITATWNVPSATVAQSLGRPLAGNAANVAVNILDPGQKFGDRITQLDLRFAKILRYGRSRLNVGVDVYNALNSNTPLTYINVYGATWGRPNSVLDARFAKVSAQFDF